MSTNATPDISLILTAYNFEAYIEAAIQSLLQQDTGWQFELIVVDDCSSDGTLAKIQAFQDERIQLIQHTENKGAAASINEAFALARGRYIGRFDGDDVWLPHFLSSTVAILEQNPQVGLVYGDVAFIDPQGAILNPHSPVPNYNEWDKPALLQALLSDYLICAPAILARREAWALAFPLPEYLLYCDFEMALHMAAQWEFRYLPQVLAQYRLHPQNMHSTALRQRRAEASIMDSLQRFRAKFPALLKHSSWNTIYRQRYLQLGDQYFGAGEMLEARRCYTQGYAYTNPSKGYFRRWLATYLPADLYASLKQSWFKTKNYLAARR